VGIESLYDGNFGKERVEVLGAYMVIGMLASNVCELAWYADNVGTSCLLLKHMNRLVTYYHQKNPPTPLFVNQKVRLSGSAAPSPAMESKLLSHDGRSARACRFLG
jgi:hypothetical protein